MNIIIIITFCIIFKLRLKRNVRTHGLARERYVTGKHGSRPCDVPDCAVRELSCLFE